MRRPALHLLGVVVLVASIGLAASAAPPPAPACPVCEDRLADALADDDAVDYEVSSDATVRVRTDGTAVWVVENDVEDATATDLPDERRLAADLERTARETRGFDGTVESVDVTVDDGGSVAVELVVDGTVDRHAGAWVYAGLYVAPGEAVSGHWVNADRLVVEGPEETTALATDTGVADGGRVVLASDDATAIPDEPIGSRTTLAFAPGDGVVAALQARAAVLRYRLPMYTHTASQVLLPVGVFAVAFGAGVAVVARVQRRVDSAPVPGTRTLTAVAVLAAGLAAVAPPGVVELALGTTALVAPIAVARTPSVARGGRRRLAVCGAPIAAALAVAVGRTLAVGVGIAPPLPAGAVGVVGFAAVVGAPVVAALLFDPGRRATIATVVAVTALVLVATIVSLGPAAGPDGLLSLVLPVLLAAFGIALALAYALGVLFGQRPETAHAA